MDPEWAMSLRAQCERAGVKYFMKQMGGARDKRGDFGDLDPRLQLRELPNV